MIPADGEIVEGIASVDESAITGESAPVIRESGGDRSSVTGGTRVLSDRIVVAITAEPRRDVPRPHDRPRRGRDPPAHAERDRPLDPARRPVGRVRGRHAPSLVPMAHYAGTGITLAVLASLFVALIPTTIGALLSAIGIAGMNRLVRKNVLATSGRAVEAAGDVSVLLLDKTGTITLGNRQAARFVPVARRRRARAGRGGAALARSPTRRPRGARSSCSRRSGSASASTSSRRSGARFIPFTAETRMSGVDLDGRAAAARARPTPSGATSRSSGGTLAGADRPASSTRSPAPARRRSWSSDGARALGVIELKDVVKEGIRERFAELRAAGIRTVMITGDNPLTAAAIAAEAGVDDFLAEATPEAKLALIRKEQEGGRLVAMTGDGTNDAPALAQADVGVAMNAGTTAAKEAGNMVDLDSNPTKLLDVVEIGKQMLITRGALTTFSIANDLAKFFAIVPAIFLTAYPQLDALNILDAAHTRRARSSRRSSSTP